MRPLPSYNYYMSIVRWLECYENGTAQYSCDKACGIAQRRVNTYKLAREVSCTARELGEILHVFLINILID